MVSSGLSAGVRTSRRRGRCREGSAEEASRGGVGGEGQGSQGRRNSH